MNKIIHLITSLEGGGTENFLYQILTNSPKGYDHQVYYLKNDGVIGERIRRHQIPVQKTSTLEFYQILRREKPPLLHTCLYSAHQVGRSVGKWAGVPAIISSQRSIDLWQKPWQGVLDCLTLPFCSAVIANSHAAAQVIEHRRGRRPFPQLFEIPNSIDVTRFQSQDRLAARLRYQLSPDAIVGGTLMRLHTEKGSDFIPDFAERLLPASPRLHLLIGGVGPLENSIKTSLASTSYKDRIHWIGWENDTPAFLSACDFFWSLSREESFPQSLVEASAVGLPWVAPETGGVSELLSKGAVGITFKRMDIPGAVASVNRMIYELPPLTHKSQAAIPVIHTNFSLTKMVADVYNVFNRFMTSSAHDE